MSESRERYGAIGKGINENKWCRILNVLHFRLLVDFLILSWTYDIIR